MHMQIWLIFTGLLLLAGLGILAWYLSAHVLNPSGKGAARRTARKLRRLTLFPGYHLVSGVRPAPDAPVLEHVLVGPFGLLAVHTLPERGEYYGDPGGESWVLTRGETVRRTIANPLLLQQEALRALRAVFAKHNFYKIPIHTLVVLGDRSRQTLCFVKNGGEILPYKKLGTYLSHSKFEQDTGTDTDALARLLRALAQ